MFAALAAIVALHLPPPQLANDRPGFILASITLTGAGAPPGGVAPPSPTAQFFFPTGTDLILVAATL